MYYELDKKEISPRGKIVRDVIHGDIFIPDKYLQVIDTPEFQRLRRIKQLSVADSIFPSAGHTRFSHCIGTFYVMGLIIDHFESSFNEMDIRINEEDKETALLAALLHDIGHGPFSHAFENVLTEKKNNITHEEWTIKIIKDKNTDVNKAIKKHFSTRMPDKVAELICKHQEIHKEEKSFELQEINLFSILSSLISSQLDADRLDYLLRDSRHTGVKFGKIDIFRIISSLQITVYDNKYYVCIPEKFLPDIEAYIHARYQMQKVVYYHDFKIQMEQLIGIILRRALKLFEENNLEFCPTTIKNLFSDSNLTVRDYIRLDDSSFICAFQEWSLCNDPILSELCRSFLDRNKASKIYSQEKSNPILNRIKKEISELFRCYRYDIGNLEKEDFWIEKSKDYSAYKKNKENIWILRDNGLIEDLSKTSKIICDAPEKLIIWQDEQKVVFINYNVLKAIPIDNINCLIDDLRNLLANYDTRKNIEIEKKYNAHTAEVFEEVQSYLSKQKAYKTKAETEMEQTDYYYDTDRGELRSHNATLRIRQKGDSFELTIKLPILDKTQEDDQNQRFEFNKKILINNLEGEDDFIYEHLEFLDKNSDLKCCLTIRNLRTPIYLTNTKNNNIYFEMVFDRVVYENLRGKQKNDFQIEVELKSDYPHRVNLKRLTDDLEKNIEGLTSSKTSKFLRGLQLLSE